MNRVLSAAVAAIFAVATPAVLAESAEAPVEAAIEVPMLLAAAAAGETAGTPRAAPERRAFRGAGERVEARLAYIKTALKITDAQNPQWEAFANVLRKQARDRDQRMAGFRAKREQGAQRPERRNVSAIDRMEFMQKRMAERSTRLSEVITAAKPLYATLSPEQKQVADAMLTRQGRGGHHRGGRGHHRGHRGV